MRNRLLLVVAIGLLASRMSGQVLYSEKFDGLTLITNGNGSMAFKYSDVPTGMSTINNGNKTMDTVIFNLPFSAPGQKRKAWLSYLNSSIGNFDTVGVSSSWLDPIGSADMWLITPTITGIDTTTVLTWNSMAVDADFTDGFEVYVTTNTSTTAVVSDFKVPNRVFAIASENADWTSHGASLAAYSGQSIRIAFRNNSNNKYQLYLDDILVKKMSIAFDIAANALDVYRYSVIGAGTAINANIASFGYQNVTSIQMSYQVGSAAPVSETFTMSPVLGYSGTTDVTFSTPYVATAVGTYPVKVWVSRVNGSTDAVHANDTIMGSMDVLPSKPDKYVLLEENTGAWCGWCPDGYTRLNSLLMANPKVIGASIHNRDNMKTAAGDTVQRFYVQGFPSGFVDRIYYKDFKAVDLSRVTWADKAESRQNDVVPCAVSLLNKNYNASTRTLTITVKADFVGAVSGDFRLNCYIIENNVFGPYESGNGWTQHSYLDDKKDSPYFGKGDDLSNDVYKHMHVVNKMLGGAWGNAGIIPATTTAGKAYQKTYVYTFPVVPSNVQRYIADNTYILGIVQEYNSDKQHRNILNVIEEKLNNNAESVSINDLPLPITGVKVYPNPATNFASISIDLLESSDLTVNVVNTMGQVVYTQALSRAAAGNHLIELNSQNWANGIYNIGIATAKGTVNRKLTVAK